MSSRANSRGFNAFHYAQNAKAWVRDYCTAIKWGRWHPFTPMERKTREATRNEPWGPTGTMLHDLAEASSDIENCQVIFAVIELRLGYPNEKWRNVYKALQVLEFLLKRGSDHCVALANEDIKGLLENLRMFEYIAPDGRDHGMSVRIRAEAVERLLADDELLKRDRAHLRSRMKRYQGFSRTDMEGLDGVGRANSWGGAVRNPSIRGLDASELAGNNGEQGALSRGAGEMKGVSLEENKKNVAALKVIMSQGKNRTCADCLDGTRPTWASINCGVFICMHCAGIHRGLGVHVSKVRSCTLDTWLPEQVEFMRQTGNKVANEYWEAHLPNGAKPVCGAPYLEAFIRRKYVDKEFAIGVWPPSKEEKPESLQPPAIAPETPVQSQSASKVNKPKSADHPGFFWDSLDENVDERVHGFEDNGFNLPGPSDFGVHPTSADVPVHHINPTYEPSRPVAVPGASLSPADSLPLMHAHTYPDFLSFGDAAFPVDPPAMEVPRSQIKPQDPFSSTTVQHHGGDRAQVEQQEPPAKPGKKNTRHSRVGQFGSTIIVTNELDLDDLDDVESVSGAGQMDSNPLRPPPIVGFSAVVENNNAAVQTQARKEVQQVSSNPFYQRMEAPTQQQPPGNPPPRVAPRERQVSVPESRSTATQVQQPIQHVAAPAKNQGVSHPVAYPTPPAQVVSQVARPVAHQVAPPVAQLVTSQVAPPVAHPVASPVGFQVAPPIALPVARPAKPVAAHPMVAPQQQVARTSQSVYAPRDPLDELDVPIDLLSAPLSHTPPPPLPSSSRQDLFSNLEPLEPIVSVPYQQQTSPGIGHRVSSMPVATPIPDTMGSQGHVMQGIYNSGDYYYPSQRSLVWGQTSVSQPSHMYPAGIPRTPFSTQYDLPASNRRALSPQPEPSFGRGDGMPIRSIHSTDTPSHALSLGSGTSGKSQWMSPHRDIADIDKLLLQQVETLKVSGSMVNGVQGLHRGAISSIMKNPSMKDARASIGTG